MDTGDTAWVLVSPALIHFMTPGLAFFYAGMVRSKNVLGMLMQNHFAMGLIPVLWRSSASRSPSVEPARSAVTSSSPGCRT